MCRDLKCTPDEFSHMCIYTCINYCPDQVIQHFRHSGRPLCPTGSQVTTNQTLPPSITVLSIIKFHVNEIIQYVVHSSVLLCSILLHKYYIKFIHSTEES